MQSNVTPQHADMKLILLTLSIFVFGCSAAPSTSVEDQLQQLQQSIATMKQTYDEKIRRNDEKIASLEQQLRSAGTLVPQSGTVSFTYFWLIPFQNLKINNIKFTSIFYSFQSRFRLLSQPV